MSFCIALSMCLIQLAKTQSIPVQDTATTINKGRMYLLAGGAAAGYCGGMTLLYKAWYSNQPQSAFHFFDDHAEWQQVDKWGHVFSAYTEARFAHTALRWAGMPDTKATWWGLGGGILFQSTIEVFDGFSEKWGFSWSDMLANCIGGATFFSQQHYWKEQRISLKISSDFRKYSHTIISAQNDPLQRDDLYRRTNDLFGSNPATRLLKDYNAQTNWLSINPSAFLHTPPNWLPHWLNIAVGYSAENMFGGYSNSWMYDGATFHLNSSTYPRYRQFVLSPDIDFSKLKTKSTFMKTLFSLMNCIKVPAPGLEYNTLGKVKWHWIYF